MALQAASPFVDQAFEVFIKLIFFSSLFYIILAFLRGNAGNM
jgi:hypothetical protein